jgi:hypothetical protein
LTQPDFFTKQNVLLKLFLVLFLIAISVILSFTYLIISSVILIISFFIRPYIIKNWGQVLVRLFPFFISLFIFGIIFQVPFTLQAILAFRICYVLLLSVYLISSTPFEAFVADTKTSRKNSLIEDLRYFLLATFQFIPLFMQAYGEVNGKKKLSFSSLGMILHICFSKIQEVEKSVSENTNIISRSFDWKSNSYIFILFIVNLILALWG